MTWTKGKSGNPRGRLPKNIPDYITRLVISAERNIPDGRRLEDMAADDPKWFYEKIWTKMMGHGGDKTNITIDNRTQTQNVMMQLPKAEQSIIDEVVRSRLANLNRQITFHGPAMEQHLVEDEKKDLLELPAEYDDPELEDAITVRTRADDTTPPPRPASLPDEPKHESTAQTMRNEDNEPFEEDDEAR